ncbi:alpha/beta fold hydrolase [Alphaproteobacteria bacterium HT1-32]|nr:alpha/beta fold hydrolase [Alphaproteobacteria bacterium HT1-32]
MEPRLHYCYGIGPGGFHRQAYQDWQGPDRHPLTVCVHGLTRNSRDFDCLAAELSKQRHVVCPDIVGRGESDWMRLSSTYSYPNYVSDMAMLINRLGVDEVDWVGTSMGGLIGMMMAASNRSPVRRLVLNDVGPMIPKQALSRILDYLGQEFEFSSLDHIEAHLRLVHAPFGQLTDQQWRQMAEHSARQDDDGNWRLHYDPAIAEPLLAAPLQDVDLWAVWDQIKCPVLVIRGGDSDLLLPETAEEMTRRGPKADLITIADVGHAPALMDAEQINLIRDWLDD